MGLECLQIARHQRRGADHHRGRPRRGVPRVARARRRPRPERRSDATSVAAIRDLTGGNGADVVFECAGGSPKQGLAGTQTLLQAIDAVRSGGKIIGVSWFGGAAGAGHRPAARAEPALPLPGHQHAGPPGAHGPPGRLGPRAAEADDHARPARASSRSRRRSRSRRTRGSTRRSTRRR